MELARDIARVELARDIAWRVELARDIAHKAKQEQSGNVTRATSRGQRHAAAGGQRKSGAPLPKPGTREVHVRTP